MTATELMDFRPVDVPAQCRDCGAEVEAHILDTYLRLAATDDPGPLLCGRCICADCRGTGVLTDDEASHCHCGRAGA